MTVALKTLLGDHAMSAALKRGEIASPGLVFDFADVRVPNTAFKRVVRDLEFDVAELAIVTFLMARAAGVPLTLLPITLMARFQHPYLVRNAERAPFGPAELAGKRIGIRSWTVTTVMWIRAILTEQLGADLSGVQWVTFEDAHVAGFADPPGIVRARADQDLKAMLLSGEIDAAVMTAGLEDPRIVPVIADPAAAADEWQRMFGTIQINHMVAVRSALLDDLPGLCDDICRLVEHSKHVAGLPKPGASVDVNPVGAEACRKSLDAAIEMTFRQGLIPSHLRVEELVVPGA